MPATVPAGLQVKEPGWEELEPMFMLTPAHLGAAMQHWGTTGTAD